MAWLRGNDVTGRRRVPRTLGDADAGIGTAEAVAPVCGDVSVGGVIHLGVGAGSERRPSWEVCCHVCNQPRLPFLRAADGIYVAAPELCFVQLAKSMDLLDSIELGMELCATYSLGSERVVGRRGVMTTRDEVLSFLGRNAGMHGAGMARRAMKYVVDGSASTMESLLAMAFSLPRGMGGRGVRGVELNAPVRLRRGSRDWMGVSEICPDLLWRSAGICVEYDSDSWHEDSGARDRDSWRRLALESVGLRVITVRKQTAFSPSKLAEVGDILGRRVCGRVPRKDDLEYQQKWFALHHRLFSTEHIAWLGEG